MLRTGTILINFLFSNQLNYIGIDAYLPLSEAITPTVAEYNKSWQKHTVKIEKLQAKTHSFRSAL